MLSVQDIDDALNELGRRAHAAGKVDLDDILNLIEVVGIADKNQLVQFAATFYPEARVSGRLRLGLDLLWTARQTRSLKETHAPRYLGRSGTAPQQR